MSVSTNPLSIDVFVAPMRPYTCPDQLGGGEVATWAPSSSTLTSGPTEGILVDGQVVKLIHVGQGDVEGSTVFHVPSADAVICGDVVYNNVHMMMYEADEAKREAWIASIDVVASLNPKIVVAGHKSVSAADLPDNLAASQQYLRDFTTLAKKGGTAKDLVRGMLELHGDRDQPHTLWISARAEVARRA